MLRPARRFLQETMMKELLDLAEKVAAVLKSRRQTIAIAESSTGGLISAALVAVPGASADFLGGGVVFTRQSRGLPLAAPDAALHGMPPSPPAHGPRVARAGHEQVSSTRALAATGAAA